MKALFGYVDDMAIEAQLYILEVLNDAAKAAEVRLAQEASGARAERAPTRAPQE